MPLFRLSQFSVYPFASARASFSLVRFDMPVIVAMTHTVLVTDLVWLILLASLTVVAATWARVPYTVALVLVGLLVSASGLLPHFRPTSDIILLVFLPPLLFQAAIELDIAMLGTALPAVLLLAIPGVLLSTALIGLSLSWLTPLLLWPALLFGAFISATDPVAVVAMFRHLHAPAFLTAVIEGESLFNDGTALALSTVLLAAAMTGHFDAGALVVTFVWSLAAAAFVGALVAFAVSHATRLVNNHLVDTSLSVVLAYGSFLMADDLHSSGAVAVVIAGLVYGNYGRHIGLSPESRQFLDDFWSYVDFLANAVLFILIGIEANLPLLWHRLPDVVVVVAVVLATRVLIVYSLVLFRRRITITYGHVLFWGGLRGGVALAVVLSLPHSLPGYSLILASTFGVVLFTTVVQGLTVRPLAQWLGLLAATPQPPK